MAPCQEFGLLSHGIFQDDFRCLIGSLVVKLHRNAHFIVVGMGPTTINCVAASYCEPDSELYTYVVLHLHLYKVLFNCIVVCHKVI